MGIHVNIGEAKDRLSQLIAAAKRGEDVVIARSGKPEVRLTPIDPDADRRAFAAARLAFIGSCPEIRDIDWFAPISDEDLSLFYGGEVPDLDELSSRHA